MLFLHDGSRRAAHITVLGRAAREAEGKLTVTLCGESPHNQWEPVTSHSEIPLCDVCYGEAGLILKAAKAWREAQS